MSGWFSKHDVLVEVTAGIQQDEGEIDEIFLTISTMLSYSESQNLSLRVFRSAFFEAMETIFAGSEDEEDGVMAQKHFISKTALGGEWSNSIARPLPVHSPAPADDLTQSICVVLHDNPQYREKDLVRALYTNHFSSDIYRFVVNGSVGDRSCWMMEEAITVRMAIGTLPSSREEGRLILHLVNESKRPNAFVSCSISSTERPVDATGKEYTAYVIKCRQDTIEWILRHRFSDFESLHRNLKAQDKYSSSDRISGRLLPRLPGKNLLGRRLSREALVAKRMQALEDYLNALIAATREQPNKLVMEFLGMLSVASANPRTIRLAEVMETAQPGDLLLFKSNFPMSVLQRTVTGSEFDHIGLVVYRPCDEGEKLEVNQVQGPLHLLEATGEGVTILPLHSRLRAYHYYRCCDRIAMRRLGRRGAGEHFEPFSSSSSSNATAASNSTLLLPLPPLTFQRLEAFMRIAQMCRYKLTLRDLLQPKRLSKRETRAVGPSIAANTVDATADDSELSADDNDEEESDDKDIISEAPATTTDFEGSSQTQTAQELFPGLHEQTFFCSALVAAGLKALAVLDKNVNERFFWPGSFTSSSGRLDNLLQPGFAFSAEYDVDCRELELGKLRHVRPSLADDDIARGLPSAMLAVSSARSPHSAASAAQSTPSKGDLQRPAALFVPSLV